MHDLRDDPVPPQLDTALLTKIRARRAELGRRRRQRRRGLLAIGALTIVIVGAGSQFQRDRSNTTVVASAKCAVTRNPPVSYLAGESLRATVLPAGFVLTEGSETDIGATFALRYTNIKSTDQWVLVVRQQRLLEPAAPDARAGSVHDQPALISDTAITWQATDTIAITISASGPSGDELLRIANGVSYNPGTPATLTDADLRPRRDLTELDTFYRKQLLGTIDQFELRQMFAADIAAAALREPSEYTFPYWIGRPTDTVVVLLASGSFQTAAPGKLLRTDVPEGPGVTYGAAAIALNTEVGVARSLGILPSLPEFLVKLPDRTSAGTCQTSGSSPAPSSPTSSTQTT